LTLRPFGAFQFALQVGRHLLEALPVGIGVHGPREALRAGDLLRRSHPRFPPIRCAVPQAPSKDWSLTVIPIQPGQPPVSSSRDTAVANCAAAKGFSIRMLPTTPCDFQSGPLAPVM
jgi:hypothetical protein